MEMEEINQELGSSPPLPPPHEQDSLPSVGPLLPPLLSPLLPPPLPPPDPADGEQWRSACKEIALWTGPECNLSSAQYAAPQGTPDAPGPGSIITASTMVTPQLELGPCGGPSPQSAAGNS